MKEDCPVDIYGLYIDEKLGQAILNYVKTCSPEKIDSLFGAEEPTVDGLLRSLEEEGTVSVICGEACRFSRICNDQNPVDFEDSGYDDRVYHIALSNGYKSLAELVDETRGKVFGLLPCDYRIADNLVHIENY